MKVAGMPISICNEVLPAPSSLSFRVPNNGSEPITELFSYFQEFEETGLNAKLGYQQPEDLRNDNTTVLREKGESLHPKGARLPQTNIGR
jgi:hypothetical protein